MMCSDLSNRLVFEPLDILVDEHAELMAQAISWEWPEEPTSRVELQREAQLDDKCFQSYSALREDGVMVAGLSLSEIAGQMGTGKAHLGLYFDIEREREDLVIASLRHLERDATEAGFREAFVYVRDDRPGRAEVFERLGYQLDMIDKATRANLTDFDPAEWEHFLQLPAMHGCRIATLADLEQEGVDWRRDLYELRKRLFVDVPIPGGWDHPPFEYSVRFYDDPIFTCKELTAVVLTEQGQMVGTSELSPNLCVSTTASTGLTGVDREWRRKGLASALKVFLMVAAKQRGILHLTTGNEQENPMLDLNYQLGFRDWFTMRTLRKELV